MKFVKEVGISMFLLGSAHSEAVMVRTVGCVADSEINDSSCDGTLAAPCRIKITESKLDPFEIGSYLRLTYEQPGDSVFDPITCASNGTACELYTSQIYVKVESESFEYDAELSKFGIFALCKDSCLMPDGASFTGVCQDPMDGSDNELGCINPALDATTVDLCASSLVSMNYNKVESIMKVGRCDVDASDWNDDSKPCTEEEPCEVKILDYVTNGGAVGDIVEIKYIQEESSDMSMGQICAEVASPSEADSCEAYSHYIYATVLAAAPSSSEVELSPHGIRSLCIGPCNSDSVGYFSGVCQLLPDTSDGTECNWPTGTGSVCEAPLVGKITYLLPPISTTYSPPLISSTPREISTSGSAELSVVLSGIISCILIT